MLKTILIALLLLFTFFGNGTDKLLAGLNQKGPESNTGTLEKMIVAGGGVALDVDLNLLGGTRSRSKQLRLSTLRFDVERDSFFTVLVFNNELRGPTPSSMNLIPQGSATVPAMLNESLKQLVVENAPWGGPYELMVRDGKTGFVFFNIEGYEYNYDSTGRT